MRQITWDEFSKVEMRVGAIVSAEIFQEAHKPAYKIEIDFGDLGFKKTSAQITKLYETENLIGKQIIAVVNFPPKQIANFMSECLILGVVGEDQNVTLVTADMKCKNGDKVG